MDFEIHLHGIQNKINRKIEILFEMKKKAEFLADKFHESN